MATRRCLKSFSSLFSPNKLRHNNNSKIISLLLHTHSSQQFSNLPLIHPNSNQLQSSHRRHFSSSQRRSHINKSDDDEDADEDEDDDDDDDEEDELSEEDDEGDVRISNSDINRTYSLEETIEEAAAIGYKVVGPLDPTERPFKHREPYFAVVQIGSHQFKVSNGDCIYTEKLKFCEVNDKLILNKVLMVGSQTQTIIGRPILPDATVHAVVEEHALDAKVIIFKKKRRKNYRRTKGHRQELTRLRITDIQGIEKPEKAEKPEKVQRPRKVAVEA